MRVGEASTRFRGERGAAYYRGQSEIGDLAAELNAWKFMPHVTAADAVIDFGCGTGALLARLPAARKLGVEVNDRAREEAASRGLEMYASAAELPDDVADVVISNHALEHTQHPFAELAELRCALKPGGRLVLWLPLDDWRSQRRPRDDDFNLHLYTWTPLLLRNLLGEVGFEVEHAGVSTSGWRFSYVPLQRRLPSPLYRLLTFATAVGLRRRQLYALARRPS